MTFDTRGVVVERKKQPPLVYEKEARTFQSRRNGRNRLYCTLLARGGMWFMGCSFLIPAFHIPHPLSFNAERWHWPGYRP